MSLRTKLQRLAWRGYIDAATRLHELYSLSWESTLRCNLTCAHCASGCGPARATDELSTAEAIALVESIAADLPAGQVRGAELNALKPSPAQFKAALAWLIARARRRSLAWSWLSTNRAISARATRAGPCATGASCAALA